VEDVVDQEDVLSWFDRAMAELDAATAGLPPLGPPGGRYANELFTGGRGAVQDQVGPRDNPDPATWRTEIGWPVFRFASSPVGSPANRPSPSLRPPG
jgi:hypothetical protein